MAANVSGLCVVALIRNLKLTTTLDRAITQNPCYVPFLFEKHVRITKIYVSKFLALCRLCIAFKWWCKSNFLNVE